MESLPRKHRLATPLMKVLYPHRLRAGRKVEALAIRAGRRSKLGEALLRILRAAISSDPRIFAHDTPTSSAEFHVALSKILERYSCLRGVGVSGDRRPHLPSLTSTPTHIP
jgi:hypothetical protein